MRTEERFGYLVVQWSEDWDPSLLDLLVEMPELVLGRRVAITSCDSGPYKPNADEMISGWSMINDTALSPRIEGIGVLPTPGFDEWYVYEDEPAKCPDCSFVNYYGFSPLDSSSEKMKEFWYQIEMTKPMHVLGAGTPNMFLVTRDQGMFERAKMFNRSLDNGAPRLSA
ncbi:MAG TPA: hypothetical protein VEC35_00170 [Noviherbaspirillum sp.]|nr:hypothetical protein [Noviherbaspirillum sp.]